jgi:hypothetical protein
LRTLTRIAGNHATRHGCALWTLTTLALALTRYLHAWHTSGTTGRALFVIQTGWIATCFVALTLGTAALCQNQAIKILITTPQRAIKHGHTVLRRHHAANTTTGNTRATAWQASRHPATTCSGESACTGSRTLLSACSGTCAGQCATDRHTCNTDTTAANGHSTGTHADAVSANTDATGVDTAINAAVTIALAG